MVRAFIQSALQYHERMWYIFSMEGLSGKQAPNVSALPMELIDVTRLEMLLKLIVAVLFASALAVCSPMPLLASPLLLWTCVDIFRYVVGSSLVPSPSCVDLQLSVASPILYGPCPPD